MDNQELTLPESLILLALNDETGSQENRQIGLFYRKAYLQMTPILTGVLKLSKKWALRSPLKNW